MRSAYVRIEIHICRMLNESQQKQEPRRQHSTHKDRMKTNDVQIEIEKVSEEKEKMKISQHQQRKKTSRKGNTHTSGSQGARGGCSAETKYDLP